MAKRRGVNNEPGNGNDGNGPPQRVLVWSEELKAKVLTARDEIARVDAARAVLNSERKAAVEKVVAAGIPRAVLLRELKHAEVDPAKRIGEDEATVMVRYALGIPMSKDLLTLDMFALDGKQASAPESTVADLEKHRAKGKGAEPDPAAGKSPDAAAPPA